jgi:transcriptional regulator with XRE-family HTH domain
MTQNEFADLLGYKTYTSVSNLEHRSDIKLSTLVNMAEKLGRKLLIKIGNYRLVDYEAGKDS